MKRLLNKTARQIHWLPSISCNYDCAYCFNPRELRQKDRSKLTDIKRITDAFLNLPETCTVVLCGGEPFHQKNLLEICRQISQRHYLEFVTNLSYDVSELCASIGPDRVINLSISLHIDERERRNGVDKLLRNLNLLKEKGYHFEISQVLYPPVLSRFDSILEFFEKHGIRIFPKTFEGEYLDKWYPAAYTDLEKAKILKYIEQSSSDYEDVRHAKEILLQAPSKLFSFKGRLCTSGYDDIVITQDGSVLRCWTNNDDESSSEFYETNHLGNFFDGTFQWHDRIKPCTFSVCYCPLMGFECTNRAQEYDA